MCISNKTANNATYITHDKKAVQRTLFKWKNMSPTGTVCVFPIG